MSKDMQRSLASAAAQVLKVTGDHSDFLPVLLDIVPSQRPQQRQMAQFLHT